jgi:hypothetical protein
MGNGVRPGPSSLAGLAWLARVGPAPLDAWRCAMKWGPGVARSHARRLEQEGWLSRFRMTHGTGSLFVATRRGVRMSGLEVSAAAPPAPTWWAHDCACAWTAAWLSRRGREWKGPREVLCDGSLKGEVGWLTGGGWRRAGHCPDLAVQLGERVVVVEVELQPKARKRLGGILGLYGDWLGDGRIAGVIYVCANAKVAERVNEIAEEVGVPDAALRTELLSVVEAQARGEAQ